jgi:hypothetical protein
MNILFDKGSSQVQVQLATGTRLNTLFGTIQREGWEFDIGPDRITSDSLAGVNCLVILTRHRATKRGTTNPFPSDWDFAFTPDELAAIQEFNVNGGGLLLISNHGPFGPGDVDWSVNDRVLAAQFGVAINPAAYQMPGRPRPPLTMSGPNLSPNPNPQKNILEGVTSIVPHNSCAVSAPLASPLATIPPEAENTSPTYPNGPAGQSYALVVAPNRGQIIVAGNSGIAGDPDSDYPAKGMIDAGSNLQFLLNALNWVGTP